ncbi:MAG: hypothetical protein QXL14_00715 [Candidatus Aenigmatarchaeota archaeon]
MVVKIKIIWAKTCPICKRVLKEVILPLQEMFYDRLVVEFKETSPIAGFEGTTPLLSGGFYKTAFGKTPEIYVDDKVYVISHGSYSEIYKFLTELIKKLNIYEESVDMTVYRRRYIIKRVDKIVKRLKELLKEENKEVE